MNAAERFHVRAGELGVVSTGDAPEITLKKYSGHSTNGQASWKAQQRPGPNDPPVLQTTVATLEAAERVLMDWTGVAYLNPDRPL